MRTPQPQRQRQPLGLALAPRIARASAQTNF